MMVLESSYSLQVTLALTAGLGCGLLIGVLLASRRKRLPLKPTGEVGSTTETAPSLEHPCNEVGSFPSLDNTFLATANCSIVLILMIHYMTIHPLAI